MIEICKNYKLRNISGLNLLICRNIPINNIWVFELNYVGSIIWNNCDGCKDIDELINRINVFFNSPLTDENVCAIYDYLLELQQLNLVEGVRYVRT